MLRLALGVALIAVGACRNTLNPLKFTVATLSDEAIARRVAPSAQPRARAVHACAAPPLSGGRGVADYGDSQDGCSRKGS
jgi:hypothetical protein